jgi:hypothetical protein
MQFVLARSRYVVLTIRHVLAYPKGIEFELESLTVSEPDDPEDLMGFQGLPYYTKRARTPDALPEGLFRFGLQFADGSKVTTLRYYHAMHAERPKDPVLMPSGSGATGPAGAHTRYWLWPLPLADPLAFVCEWPALGIPFTRHEVDTSGIREAAARAVQIWPDPS